MTLARSALGAGVRRYFPWQFGVDYDVIGRGSAQDLFDEQLDVRELLRSQTRTEWVIVSTGMFTSFLFEPSFGVVDLAARTVNALGSWDNAVTVTTLEDIAALTAEVLFAEPRISNEVTYVATHLVIEYEYVKMEKANFPNLTTEQVGPTDPCLQTLKLAGGPNCTSDNAKNEQRNPFNTAFSVEIHNEN